MGIPSGRRNGRALRLGRDRLSRLQRMAVGAIGSTGRPRALTGLVHDRVCRLRHALVPLLVRPARALPRGFSRLRARTRVARVFALAGFRRPRFLDPARAGAPRAPHPRLHGRRRPACPSGRRPRPPAVGLGPRTRFRRWSRLVVAPLPSGRPPRVGPREEGRVGPSSGPVATRQCTRGNPAAPGWSWPTEGRFGHPRSRVTLGPHRRACSGPAPSRRPA